MVLKIKNYHDQAPPLEMTISNFFLRFLLDSEIRPIFWLRNQNVVVIQMLCGWEINSCGFNI